MTTLCFQLFSLKDTRLKCAMGGGGGGGGGGGILEKPNHVKAELYS